MGDKRSARMRSDSVKNMSAYADQNHAPSLTDVRLELSRDDFHLFQMVSNSKFVSVGVQSPTEINALRGCAS